MVKDKFVLKRFKQAIGDKSRFFIYTEEVSGENGGTKKRTVLRIEKTAVNLCGKREALEKELKKQGLRLHESKKSSPFMHVCDEAELGGV